MAIGFRIVHFFKKDIDPINAFNIGKKESTYDWIIRRQQERQDINNLS